MSESVAALISGGVDSSVAAALAVRDVGAGSVRGYYLKIWLEEDAAFLGECPWEEDLRYAEAVAQTLGIPLEVVPLQQTYYERIVMYVTGALRAGRTPSPDVLCNRRIKFGAFFDAIGTGSTVATGHYAQVGQTPDGPILTAAADERKDQTYFLSHIRPEQLRRLTFPIGGIEKGEVRRLAATIELPTADRPDSQGICFLGKIRYRDFVRHYLGERPGKIVARPDGAILGDHQGHWFYTIGQRSGLGLSGGPWYVVDKSADENTVFVAHDCDRDDDRLWDRRRIRVHELHWITPYPDLCRVDAVKLRHTPLRSAAQVVPWEPNAAEVILDQPDHEAAPGQFAVFYEGRECLGGATIVGYAPRP